VTAYQSRLKGKEVPLGGGGFQHGLRVDAHAVENFSELVDQSDIDIELAILNDFCSFGQLNGWSRVRSGRDDRGIR